MLIGDMFDFVNVNLNLGSHNWKSLLNIKLMELRKISVLDTQLKHL